MVTRTHSECQATGWKSELAAAITRPEELLEILALSPSLLPEVRAASQKYRLLVPRGFAARIRRSDWNDPLLRQVVPRVDELTDAPGYSLDPLAEHGAVQAPGLLKKFKGRALLLITGACAIHCRYCFRRYFPYAEGTIQADGAGAALDTLAKDASVSEVILSGGDPLMLDDSVLSTLIGRLEQLPHLKRLRLHTRMPIVLPSRITTRLCEALSGSRLQSSIVVHVNHSRELESEAHAGLGRLRQAGITLLNQSVLLKGVNDSEHSLTELSEALFECGVLPYYLHMLDRVAGTAHFDLDDTKAVVLLDRLRAQLPGYLVPRLVREQSGCPYKTPIESRQGTMRRTEDISYGALDAEHR